MRNRNLRGSFLALGLSVSLSVVAQTGAVKTIDVPPGELASALETLRKQTGSEIMWRADQMRGVRAKGVRGELAAEAALARLLEGTGYTLHRDPSGAFVVVKDVDAVKPAKKGNREKTTSAPDETAPAQPVELAKVTITGSRIRGVATESINPVLIYTRQDIDRMGATTMGDFTRRITQNVQNSSLGGTGLATSDAFRTDARTTVNLRGLGNNTTLVLIDGRRIAKTGQGFNQDDYDLAGIPLSAVERVEVLTDGASAIYGADAIGGVVNVILRKDYVGADAVVSYGNTFDTDTAERTVMLSAGHSTERFSAFFSGSWADSNSLARRDRAFSASDDKRPLGGSDHRRQGAGGAGRVFTVTGSPLPGLTSFQAGIPPHQDGRNLTIDDFRATDGIVEAFDLGPLADAISPYRRRNAALNLQYRLNSAFEFFANTRFAETATYSRNDPPLLAFFRVPADYIYNPFGVDVYMDKYLWELGSVDVNEVTRSRSYDIGSRGDLFGDWRYEASAAYTASKRRFDTSTARILSASDLTRAMLDPNDPLVLLNDSTVGPTDPLGPLSSYMLPQGYGEAPETTTASLVADGSLFQVPGGTVSMAAGVERRIEKVEFDIVPTSSLPSTYRGSASRNINALFAELTVPIVGGDLARPFLRKLEMSISGRSDDYSDFGRSTVGRYGMQYRPTDWLMLRATYGEGFKTPTLTQLYQAVSSFDREFSANSPFNFATDPLRNDEFVVGSILTTQGGNDALRPEQSESTNIGFVVDVPGRLLRGLTFSVDYYDLHFFDRVGSVDPNDIVNFFPDRVTRGPDLGDGLPGKIVAIDFRAVNFAKVDTSGFDVRVDWNRTTELGEFNFTLEGSKVRRYIQQTAPTSLPADLTARRPIRVIGSMFWTRKPLEIGWTTRYIGGFEHNAAIWADSAIEHDLQVSYDFGRMGGTSGPWGLLQDTSLSLTVFNVFDREPPFIDTVFGATSTDPRMRRYVLTLRRSF